MKFCKFNTNTLKKSFVITGYIAYTISTIIENHIEPLGYYNYIFVGIVGACIKLSQHTEYIERIIHDVMPEAEFEKLKERLDSIVEIEKAKSERSSQRILDETPRPEENVVEMQNEPYTPSSNETLETHRDYKLPTGQIIRIKNNV